MRPSNPKSRPPTSRLTRRGWFGIARCCGSWRRSPWGLARSIARQAEAAAQAGELDSGGAALALGRVAKVVRQTCALENQIHQDWRDGARRDEESVAAPQVYQASLRAVKRRLWTLYGEDKVRDAVEKVIAHAQRSESDAERLLADLTDRLDDEGEVAELMNMQVGAAVSRICEALGLTIDWSLWAGQAWVEGYGGTVGTRPP